MGLEVEDLAVLEMYLRFLLVLDGFILVLTKFQLEMEGFDFLCNMI
jgi:hypothetical protein